MTSPVSTEPFATAVAYVDDVIESGEGLYLLTGERGTGKSTVLEYCRRRSTDHAAVLLDTLRRIDGDNLAALLNDAFNVADGRKKGSQAQALRYFLKLGTLRAKGTRFVLVLDDVEEIHSSGAELITALLQMKAEQSHLVTIILAGDLRLNALLDRNYRWGIQKLIRDSHEIEPLALRQADSLIEHIPLHHTATPLAFRAGARRTLVRLSRGIPGAMIELGQRAADVAWAAGANRVSTRMVRGAASGNYRSLSGAMTNIAWKSALALLILLLVPISVIQRDGTSPEFSELPVGGVVASRTEPDLSVIPNQPGLATREDDIALTPWPAPSSGFSTQASAAVMGTTSDDNVLELDQNRQHPGFGDSIPAAPLIDGQSAVPHIARFSSVIPSQSTLYRRHFNVFELRIPAAPLPRE